VIKYSLIQASCAYVAYLVVLGVKIGKIMILIKRMTILATRTF